MFLIKKERTTLNTILSFGLVILLVAGFYIAMKRGQNDINKEISFLDSVSLNNQNQKSNYSLRLIPLETESEGAEMTVYFDRDNGATKIIEASYGGETFIMEYKYYFADINNFFLMERYQRWDRSYSVEGRIKTLDEINKYYFSNLKMLHWINPKNQIVNSQLEFRQKEQQIFKQLDEFLRILGSAAI